MTSNAGYRHHAFLALAFLALTGTAQAQFPLTLESKLIEAVRPTTITVISNGAINLSGITIQQIDFFDFRENASVSADMGADKVVATARKLIVTVRVSSETVLGERQMGINFGDVKVSLTFTLVPPVVRPVVLPFMCPPSCQLPRICVNKKCVLPPTKCNPRCPVDQFCNEERKRCEKRPPG